MWTRGSDTPNRGGIRWTEKERGDDEASTGDPEDEGKMATGLRYKLQRAGEGRTRSSVLVEPSGVEFNLSYYTFRKNKYKMYNKYT